MVIQNCFRHACGTVPRPIGFVLLFILSAAFLMPARGQELNKSLREAQEIAKPEGSKILPKMKNLMTRIVMRFLFAL